MSFDISMRRQVSGVSFGGGAGLVVLGWRVFGEVSCVSESVREIGLICAWSGCFAVLSSFLQVDRNLCVVLVVQVVELS